MHTVAAAVSESGLLNVQTMQRSGKKYMSRHISGGIDCSTFLVRTTNYCYENVLLLAILVGRSQ